MNTTEKPLGPNLKNQEESTTTKSFNLVSLPDDILYIIFLYLDIKSLGNICSTCSRLRDIASRDCVWTHKSKKYLIMLYPDDRKILQPSPRQRQVCRNKSMKRTLLKEKCRIAKNWKDKKFKDVQFVKHKTKLMPWLKLDQQKLYVSNATNIHCYQLFRDGSIREDKERQTKGGNSDVTRFVVSNDVIVSGYRNGVICGYDKVTNRKKYEYEFPECNDTQAVDTYSDILVAGFRDGSVKVINTSQDDESAITTIRETNVRLPNRVWSVGISPDGSIVSVGNAAFDRWGAPLEVYDVVSGRKLYNLGGNLKRGAGVLDIKYESPSTMLTCGYDTSLRLWDLRTQTCVKEWVDPFDVEVSSLQTDGNNAIVTGTFQYGMSRLWDKRLKTPVQLYYCGKNRSPVYCLDTDFQRLFVALDTGIHILDFTTY